ncbi:hypothetical protein BJ166DRAFT_603695 [Pestalotiopsis sp. NC0098]|nr:hypothetical protein BJ166DRAFT_603695 [Pestalotiopsis sp. NC0098]
MIFVRPYHVINPTKSLISPLLSVNRESRSCALKVYNLPLEIHEGEGWEQVRRREWEAQQRNKSASTQCTSKCLLGRHDRQTTEKSQQELKVQSNHGGVLSGSSEDNSSKDNGMVSSSTIPDDTPIRPIKVSTPLSRVNLQLSTMICPYWIRQYTRRPSNQALSELEKARFFPTSPGPWRLGATPVSRMLSLSERSKVGRTVLVKLHDSPGHRWQSWVKSHHPEGPGEVSRYFYPGVHTLFFLTLGLQNGSTTVLHDLNEMGWHHFRQKMGNRIIEWTSDEDSDKEK